MTEKSKNAAFESKVVDLIELTRRLDVPQILALRRLTINDVESRRWATDHELGVVFTVILTKALERLPPQALREARERDFEPLLPPGQNREDDRRILSEAAGAIAVPVIDAEADLTQASFKTLMARKKAPPERTVRRRTAGKEPEPLFAAQIDSRPASKEGAAEAVSETVEMAAALDFASLFDEVIRDCLATPLALMRLERPAVGYRLPFLCAPEFGAVYDDVLRRFILPQMRQSRHLQALSANYNWAEVGAAKLVEIIHSGEINNPILYNWDARWLALRPAKGGTKAKRPRTDEETPWQLFREDATRGGYEPPQEEHLPILRDLIRWDTEAITQAWRDLTQLSRQESGPGGRDGALRDGFSKWVAKLPPHAAEHLAIKLFFALPRPDLSLPRQVFDAFGRSDADRRRNAPFLNAFIQTLPR
ncbi:MAG: hypothetical protein M0006_17630 [Magnetospirillum sp.]|nr:hypothetical protein [Magnetospirillum sp.]